MSGLVGGVIEKMLNDERKKEAGMPEDNRDVGVLRFPINPQATLLEGNAQRNLDTILQMAGDDLPEKKKPIKVSSGQGQSLPLSKGMISFPADKLMSFKATYGF